MLHCDMVLFVKFELNILLVLFNCRNGLFFLSVWNISGTSRCSFFLQFSFSLQNLVVLVHLKSIFQPEEWNVAFSCFLLLVVATSLRWTWENQGLIFTIPCSYWLWPPCDFSEELPGQSIAGVLPVTLWWEWGLWQGRCHLLLGERRLLSSSLGWEDRQLWFSIWEPLLLTW